MAELESDTGKECTSNSEAEEVQDDNTGGDLWNRLNADLKTAKKETSALKKALKRAEGQLERVNRYNDDLRTQVEKLNKKVRKYKRAAKYAERKAKKRAKDKCDVGIQVSTQPDYLSASQPGALETVGGVVPTDVNQVTSTTEAAEKAGKDWTQPQEEGDAPLSIADSIRSAAEEVMESTGFVYDEATGLYFDHNSGYYYDSQNSLYYDPTTGIYSYFDEKTQTYEFHSQVDLKQLENRMYPNRNERSRAKKKRKLEDTEQSAELPKIEDQKEKSILKSEKECKKKKKRNKNETTKGTKKEDIAKEDVTTKVKVDQPKTEKIDMFDDSDEDKSDKLVKKSENNTASQTKQVKESDDKDSRLEMAELDDNMKNPQEDKDDMNEGDNSSDMEEGELSDTSSEAESSEEESEEEFVKEWPPCIRAMVTKSDILEEGTLFVITCTGATVGREKNLGHAILIEDPQISKMHCDIHYDEEKKTYMIKDHASQNGTFLNSKRISKVKMMGEDNPLKHKDVLQIGSTTIELHIHPGTDTCNACEPGLVQAELLAAKPKEEIVITSKADVEKNRRAQLKGIKKKYGLANSSYVDNKAAIENPKYSDKAAVRRKEKGSDNPYEPDAQPASVLRPISAENKGHKLLKKMGWSEGDTLGKSQQGLQEPIHVLARGGSNAGLGAGGPTSTMDNVDSLKANEKWFKAQQRFANMQGTSMDTTAPVNNKTETKKATFTKFVQGQTVKFNLSTKVKDIQNPLGTNEDDSEENEDNT